MFNPDTNVWVYKAAMPTARSQPVIMPFENQLHVIGGVNLAGQRLETVEEYNPATDTWKAKPDTNQLRSVNGAARVAGRNFIAAWDYAYLEAYDGSRNLWEPAGPLPTKMGDGDMVSPFDGNLYVLNGTSFVRGTPTGTTDIYARTSEAPRLVVDNNNVAHVYWYDYATYNVDGQASRSNTNASVVHRSFDPVAGTWSSTDSAVSGAQGQRGFVTVVNGITTHMAYGQYDATLGRTGIYYINNSGSGWSAPTLAVIEDVGYIQTIDMRVDGQGNPMLMVMTYDSQAKPYRIFYTALKNGVWSVPETVLRDSVLLSPSRLFVDTSNVPVVLYQSQGNQNVYLTKRLDDGHWANGIVANSASQLVNNFDAAVDPTQNKLFLAYSASLNGHGEIFASSADLTTDIVAPNIAMSGPLTGTPLKGGNTLLLSWNTSDDRGVTSVTLKYSTDGGSSFTNIATNLAPAGSFLWTLPNISSNALTVYAVAVDAVGNQRVATSGSLLLTPKSLISIDISGPGIVDEGSSASFALVASYDNGTSSAVSGTLSLLATSYATVSGTMLTGSQVTANQTVSLRGSYTEGGVVKTATIPVTVRNVPIGGQNITFGIAPTLTVGGTGTLTATGGASGNAIVFSSTTPTICTVAGNTVTGVSVGICVVAANQAGNGTYEAATTVTQNVTVGPPRAPFVSLSPSSLSFVDQHIGTTSPTRTIALTNTGGAALTITSIAPSNSVFGVLHNCGSSLAAGVTCNLNVSFTPVATGTRVGSVTLTSNASGSPHSVTVSGVGVASNAPICTLGVTPASVSKNGRATLTANCSPTATSYTWTGGTCAGTTTASCAVSPAVTTTYSVTGTNSYGSNTATVTVTAKAVDLTPILMLLLD